MSDIKKNNIVDAKEFEIVNESETSIVSYVHVFTQPFTYEGKTYTELTFDWNSLTGSDSLAIEAEMQSLGKVLISPEFSGEYLIRIAAKACTEKIGSDVLCAMPLRDYNKIRSKARSFLLNMA